MSLQKQLEYNKDLFMYRVLSSEAPECISNLYTHIPLRYSNSSNYHLPFSRDIVAPKGLIWAGVRPNRTWSKG